MAARRAKTLPRTMATRVLLRFYQPMWETLAKKGRSTPSRPPLPGEEQSDEEPEGPEVASGHGQGAEGQLPVATADIYLDD